MVADVKHRSLDGASGREAYIPVGTGARLLPGVRPHRAWCRPAALVPSIRAAIWDIDSNQALGTPVTLEEYIGRTLRPRRLLTGVISLFAVTALLLAAFGVYGVVGYRVAQRMKEIAIRVALGAPRWRVTVVVLTDAVTCVGLGLTLGLLLALAAASAISSQLYAVAPFDTVAFASACTVVVTAALVAAYLPARRAPRIDPIAALRSNSARATVPYPARHGRVASNRSST